eukprot:gb/GFBE01044861.1/.p1 GENE.gb/GFBE01044861.1/~~gb/GFBE01044861.1/.p1  ORF type:complete len:878 (+),score=165.67 gb/GFBE01044861.1/:1-2634(+)
MSSCCCLAGLPPKAKDAGTSRVVLDVGGKRFTTARTTLTKGRAAGSLLAEIIEGPAEDDGVYFLDRDGQHFNVILNYLRHGPENFVMPETETARLTLLGEAKTLRLQELTELLETRPKTSGSDGTGNMSVMPVHRGAPFPGNEFERMAKLKSLNVLDTQNKDTEFDAITRVVAAIIQVPICLVSLVAEDRQWFKSKCGLDADQTDRSMSFCAFTLVPEALSDASVLVVPDATKDTRFMNNPLVTGEPNIRFYGGCPLITSEGLRMGSLCAIAPFPRTMNPQEVGLLINFAYLTAQALERKQLSESPQDDALMDPDEDLNFLGGTLRREAMKDDLKTAVVLVWARPDSMDWPLVYANEVWSELTGVRVIPPSSFPARVMIDMKIPTSSNGNSLWDHLRLNSSRGSDTVFELWKMVQKAMTSTRRDQMPMGFATSGHVRTMTKNRLSRMNVSCRFMPAELPISESSAAVKATGLDTCIRRWDRPAGWADGHWLFMQMVVDSSESNEPSFSSAAQGIPPAVPRLPTVPEFNSAETGQSSQAVSREKLNTKPPRAPFEDVRLIRLVGQGSFGSVYFSLWSGAAVAVKIIKSEAKSEEEASEDKHHFEAVLSASISHPNLVQTFKHGTRNVMQSPDGEDGQAAEPTIMSIVETWIVQEWCDGGTLRSKCKLPRVDGQPLVEGVEMLLEIARAGAYLHDLGIIHGDLTANNVLLKSAPVPKGFTCKVCDFGLARVLDGEDQEIITQTMGTVTHMPPELFALQKDKCKLTQKADVYALGVISCHLMTGKEPFSGLSAPQVVVQVARGKRPTLPEDSAQEIKDIVSACLEMQTEKRATFASCVTNFQEYLTAIGGEEVSLQLFIDPYRRCWTDPIHKAHHDLGRT